MRNLAIYSDPCVLTELNLSVRVFSFMHVEKDTGYGRLKFLQTNATGYDPCISTALPEIEKQTRLIVADLLYPNIGKQTPALPVQDTIALPISPLET